MHIAVCDDNQVEMRRICTLLDDFSKVWNCSITYEAFYNGTELIESLKMKQFDLLLLDIMMPGITGIETAKEIRFSDQDIPIVFLTSSREFAVESYRVGATDYIMKPIQKEELWPTIHKLLSTLTHKDTYLTVKSGRSIIKLPYSHIVCIEVINRTIQFLLSNGEVKEVYGYLTDYEEDLLSDINFFKPHRSYLVNLRYVISLDKNGFITTMGKMVPVARDSYSRAKSVYMKYLLSSDDRRNI